MIHLIIHLGKCVTNNQIDPSSTDSSDIFGKLKVNGYFWLHMRKLIQQTQNNSSFIQQREYTGTVNSCWSFPAETSAIRCLQSAILTSRFAHCNAQHRRKTSRRSLYVYIVAHTAQARLVYDCW